MNAGHRIEPDKPAWTREMSAWFACAANALPIAVVLIAMAEELFGPTPPSVAMGVYGAVLLVWLALFKPWSPARA